MNTLVKWMTTRSNAGDDLRLEYISAITLPDGRVRTSGVIQAGNTRYVFNQLEDTITRETELTITPM